MTQKEALRCPDLLLSCGKPLIRARERLQQFLKSQHNTLWKFPASLYNLRGKPAEQKCLFLAGRVLSPGAAAAAEVLPPECVLDTTESERAHPRIRLSPQIPCPPSQPHKHI